MGGSQVLQAFPENSDFQSMARDYLGDDVIALSAGYSTQSLLESFLIISNLPIDENTLVFVHYSPDRVSGHRKAETVEDFYDTKLFLDKTTVAAMLLEQGFSLPKSSNKMENLSRVVNNLLEGKEYERFLSERKYIENPTRWVERKFSFGSKVSREAKEFVSPEDTLAAIIEYVSSRKGKVFLLELPFNHDFPLHTAGWMPEGHIGPVKERLEQLKQSKIENGAVAQPAKLTEEYYAQARRYGDKYISLDDKGKYEAADFYDSMHMRSSGRKKLMPEFFDAVKKIMKKETL